MKKIDFVMNVENDFEFENALNEVEDYFTVQEVEKGPGIKTTIKGFIEVDLNEKTSKIGRIISSYKKGICLDILNKMIN